MTELIYTVVAAACVFGLTIHRNPTVRLLMALGLMTVAYFAGKTL